MSDSRPAWLPEAVTIGAIRDRRFGDDGRLVIDRDNGIKGSWVGTPMGQWIATASQLALLMDALDPKVDVRVGAAHRFVLNSRVDGRVDTRGGVTPPTRHAYGSLVPYALDLELLHSTVSFVHSVPERAHQSFDGALYHYPRSGRVVHQLGPGASWYQNGREDYFDQILSFETDPDAAQPTRATDKALLRWEKAEAKWAKRRTPDQAALEGPWL